MIFRAIGGFVAASLAFALSAGSAGAASGVSVTRATLPNGLRIVVLRDPVAPVVTTWLNVHAGSEDEPFEGTAHAQEHMFFRGSRTLSGAAADQIAGFTGDQDNADTQPVITQYFHLVPVEDLDLALQLDRSRFSGILDLQSDWSEERGAIEQEVTRDNSDANFRLYVKLLHHIMAGTPYADDGLGTLHSFDHQIDAKVLRHFYDTWYHPNNAIYVIAGAVDPQATIAAVDRYLGSIPAAPVPAHRTGTLAPLTPASFTDTSDQSNVEAMIAYRYPGYDDPAEYAASVVLADVLNSQRGALYDLVATGKAQAVEADPNQFPGGGMIQIVSRVAVGSKPESAIADLESVIAKYRAQGVPADLVAAAKHHEITQVATAAASVFDLAASWAESVPVEGRTPVEDAAAIAKVTPAAVDALLRKYFAPETVNVAYAVPKSSGGSESGGAGGGEENEKKATATPVHLPPWAESALHHLSVPARTIAPATFVLPNGLHVVVQPESAAAYVAVNGTIRHDAGLEEPDDQSGVQSVLEALLPYGTTTRSRIAYQTQLDAISATVQNGFAFSLGVPSGSFDRGMQLLADDELHPALDAASFAIVKAQRVDELTGDATNPDHLAAVALANGLYPDGDPERRFATPDSVKALTLDDVKAAYALAFRPDLTTISIVGDVTPEQGRAVAEKYFGGWQAAGARPDVFPHAVADNAPSSTTIPGNGRQQDVVTLEETMGLASSDPDVAPLEVANAVLSGDFSSTLIRDMRVTTGYVYSVDSSVVTGHERSTFVVRYGAAPSNVGKANPVLVRDLSGLQKTSLDAERIDRAKSRLVADVALQTASFANLAARLTANVSSGFPADYDYTRAHAELAATPNAIRWAMARWIRPRGFVTVVEGPAPH